MVSDLLNLFMFASKFCCLKPLLLLHFANMTCRKGRAEAAEAAIEKTKQKAAKAKERKNAATDQVADLGRQLAAEKEEKFAENRSYNSKIDRLNETVSQLTVENGSLRSEVNVLRRQPVRCFHD